MTSSIVYSVNDGTLGMDEVKQILLWPDASLISAVYPDEPCGGQVYVYDHSLIASLLEKLPLLDGISWTYSGGRTNVPPNL